MATASIIVICLSALLGHILASPPEGLKRSGAVGRQAMQDYINSRQNNWYFPRVISQPSPYSAIAPVPFAFSLNDLSSERLAGAPRPESSGVKALERGLSQRRFRRQAGPAMDLALSHTDASGSERPVGRVHGFGDLTVTGNSPSDHHLAASAGVGTVVWRSDNDRHSVGVGATVDHHMGSHDGFRYSSRPSPSVAVGYNLRF